MNLSGVSYFDAGFSVFLFLTTVPANLLILLGLYKFSHLLNRNYYLVITNIAISDLIMGLICDPMSISFHVKEALGPSVVALPDIEQKTMHFIFFFTNTVSVLSMAVLTIDRLGVILSPFYYYSKLTKSRMIMLLVVAWLLGGMSTIFYLYIGYIRFLVVFAFSTVIFTLIVMVVTWFLLRRRLRMAKANEIQRRDSRLRCHTDSLVHVRRRTENTIEFTQMDKRITKTFLCMLVLFIFNYLPCVILIVYMNLCKNCDCDFVHVLRDVIWLAILSSALCRPLNFVIRLAALQESIKSVFRRSDPKNNVEVPLNTSKQ